MLPGLAGIYAIPVCIASLFLESLDPYVVTQVPYFGNQLKTSSSDLATAKQG